MRGRKHSLRTICVAMVVTFSAFAKPSNISSPVRLGEVGVSVGHKAQLKELLRSAIDEELSALELQKLKASDRYVLSAKLVRLESVADKQSVRANCEVSVVLRRQSENTLHAMIKGRAMAEDGKPDAAQIGALRAAVHSAVRRVPQAIR